MKLVILADGLGTRLSEETDARPKPMVEIGGRPILWHVVNTYVAHAYEEFNPTRMPHLQIGLKAKTWIAENGVGVVVYSGGNHGEFCAIDDPIKRTCRDR